jgi:hypothetical protein
MGVNPKVTRTADPPLSYPFTKSIPQQPLSVRRPMLNQQFSKENPGRFIPLIASRSSAAQKDRVVAAIKWVDGTLIDSVREIGD